MGHAFLPPSGAGGWVECPQWAHMNALYPTPADPDTLEGDAAHWLLYQGVVNDYESVEGEVAPNGIVITRDMLYDVAPYVARLRPRYLSAPWKVAETYLPCPTIHEHNGGSPDLMLWFPESMALEVYDFKYGYWPVGAVDNWQCANYARCAFDFLGLNGLQESAVSVHIEVLQPRDFSRPRPLKVWKTDGGELRAHWNRLEAAANAAMSPNPLFKSGDHCLHCPGRVVCPALHRSALKVVEVSKHGIPDITDVATLGREYSVLQHGQTMLKARLEAVEAELTHRYKQGERGGGFTLDTSGATARRWTAPPEKVAQLGDMFGLDLRKPLATLTPTQAKSAGLPDAVLDRASERSAAPGKLVPTPDTMAYRAFTLNPVKE